MTFRLLVLLGIVLAIAAPAAAQSNPKAKNDPVAKKDSRPPPLVFYLAKGEDDACGPGCNEWIAAEGYFDAGATQRLRVVLNRLGKRKLPIFFHSLGGNGYEGRAIGRFLRQREMTVGVSETIPTGCAGVTEQACRTLKQSGQALPSILRSYAICASACVLALIGGKERHVPPGARIGVHAARLIVFRVDGSKPKVSAAYEKSKLAEINVEMRRYFQEMKIDVRLFDLSVSIPHEDVHYLSRDEIVDFGVSNHEIKEARWIATEFQPEQLSVVKFFVEATAADGKGLHTSMLRVDCGGPPNRTRAIYFRSMGSPESKSGRLIRLKTGPYAETLLGPGTSSKAGTETGAFYTVWSGYPHFELFDVAAVADTIDVADSDSAFAKPRVVQLSTAGLGPAIAALHRRCSGG
jgi:hypothetical protein